jgi:hypothetical protein
MTLTYHATNASCFFAGWLQRSAALPLVWRVASAALVTGHGNLIIFFGLPLLKQNFFFIVVCHIWPNELIVCRTVMVANILCSS